MKADTERCLVTLAFHVDNGQVDGLDVSGLTVVAIADAPALMMDGGWKLGMLMDANASPEQAEALGGIFGGALGGPMGDLVPLVGEMLGSTAAAIEYVSDGRRTHREELAPRPRVLLRAGGGHHRVSPSSCRPTRSGCRRSTRPPPWGR